MMMMISNYGTESAVSPIASISPITETGRSGSQSTPLEKPRSPIRRFCEKLWPNKSSTIISSSSSGDLINSLSVDATNSLSVSVSSWRTSKHQQLEKVFKFFDRDGDGLISPTELSKCLKTMGDDMSEEEAASALRLIDSDGDGFLGFDEFKALMIGDGDDDHGSGGGADIREAFAMYAVEGEDRITSSSLKRMLSRLGEKKSVEECRRMIKRFDVNGDGVLSFDEFHQMMTMAP